MDDVCLSAYLPYFGLATSYPLLVAVEIKRVAERGKNLAFWGRMPPGAVVFGRVSSPFWYESGGETNIEKDHAKRTGFRHWLAASALSKRHALR